MKLARTADPATYWWRKLNRSKQVRIDGFKVSAFEAPMDLGSWKALWRGVHERTERSIIRGGFLKSGDRVLEAGGGVGLVTMHIARQVGAENVLTFEAIPTAASAIVQNGKLNGMDLRVVPKALSDREGAMKMQIDGSFIGTSAHDRGFPNEIEVQTADVAEVVTEFAPNVLVIDIEGAEIEVIGRCPLDGFDRIMMETHPKIVGKNAIAAMNTRLVNNGFVQDGALSWNDTICLRRA
jgi:FkbM family methyltransferase